MNQKQTTFRLLLGTACLIAMLAGCRQRAVVKPPQVKLATTVKETSPFDVAMEFLNNLDEYQPAQVKMQILQNLREWSRMEEAPVEWFADPMFRRLPSDLKEMFSADGLATKVFQPHDALELQQSVWLRDIAKAVALQPLADPNQREWLEQAVADGKLSSDDAEDLALACRLFDWTVRNIQLDPEEQEMDILGDERDKERRDRNTLRHQYYPWENILYGHGDWLERSRVFTLLARQFGINVVILQADRGDEPAQPWCNAAMIGEELYLFDGKLGLPLPGKDESPFGRLSDYKDAPELLEPLNETGRYRIVASDLKRMVACIDATPAALSQRMKQIESRLSGDRKLALTVAPSPIAVQLRSMGISSVEIWTFPYRGYQFLSKIQQDPQQALQLLNVLNQESSTFENRGPLLRGRLLHLRGYYRGDHEKAGATKMYMQARMSKQELERFNIPIEQVPPDSPMLQNLPQDPVERAAMFRLRVQVARAMAVAGKDRATYWLGLLALDRHEYRVAGDFLKLNADDEDSAWRQGAVYGLARSLEAQGLAEGDEAKIQEAIELYESLPESPQHAGNLMRAQRLAASLGK